MSTLHKCIADNGTDNQFHFAPGAHVDEGCKLTVNGHGNSVTIGDGVVLRSVQINFAGDGNKLVIGDRCNIRGSMHLRQRGSLLEIGEGTTMVGCHLFAMEGAIIRIGAGCMFSSGIYVRTSDEHPIFDLTSGERINPAQDVVVGEHVWISEGVTLNKGAVVPTGCVVGARSFVSKPLGEENAIFAGTPAKLVRSGVRWGRYL